MDDLDARLRDLRSSESDRRRPLPDRAERHLKALLSEDRMRRRGPRSSRNILATTATAFVAIMIVVVAVLRIDGGTAQALTPPALEFTSDEQGVGDIIGEAIMSLEQSSGPQQPERGSRHLGWFVHIDMDEDTARAPVVIKPEIIDLKWNKDLSGAQTTTAAEAYWADPRIQTLSDDMAPAPGTLLSKVTFETGEFAVPSASLPGQSVPDMHELLVSLGMPIVEPGAGDVIESIDSAMGLWTLTNHQHAGLLQLLLDAGDLELLGATTDRLGRQVVGLRAEPASFPGTARVLLVSMETGRIVGIETVRTTDEPPLKAGDVVAYNLWEVSE